MQTILPALKSGNNELTEDVYKLLNNFISYLVNETTNGHNMTPSTIATYLASSRSYFQYNDIDILPSKFKYKVSMPRIYRVDEQAIDSNDIKEILHHCDNPRLKAYLLVLASGGMRAMEAIGIKEIDINFNRINFADPSDTAEPATVHIRKEFSKTKRERNIFISNEAARYLKQWIDWIYRDKSKERNTNRVARQRTTDDLIFARRTWNGVYPTGLYNRLTAEFHRVLERASLSSRKPDGIDKRRNVTFHSFRRFTKTVLSDQTSKDYSEWFLGHAKSPYYIHKPEELKGIYKKDCMKYLTFLNYPTVETTAKNFEAQLQGVVKQKDEEIAQLKQKYEQLNTRYEQQVYSSSETRDQIKELQNQIMQINKKIAKTTVKRVRLEQQEDEGTPPLTEQEQKEFEYFMKNDSSLSEE